MDKPSDAELLRRCGRDPEAFGVVYDRHARAVYAWLHREAGDRELALDLTAETFASALGAARRFRDEREGSARPWLLAIARNQLRASRRSGRAETQARRALGMPPRDYGGMDEADARLDAAALAPRVARSVGGLAAEQREAVVLRVVDDLEYDEIAARTGVSAETARSRVSRGLRRLRARLGEEQP